MKHIGLTGATGLLGSYLMKDLLTAGLSLAVFVRSNRRETAAQRVESILQMFESQTGGKIPRPVVLESNLENDDLGLNADNKRWVTQNVDTLIHNAASLEFIHDPKTNEPFRSNIKGTQHVLEFCRQNNIRQFHHVSTAYVCGLREGTILETELDKQQEFGNVYEETKFQSETTVRHAGFLDKITVFRPAIIVGDSCNGYSPTFHGFYTPLKVLYPILGGITEKQPNDVAAMIQAVGMNEGDEKNFVPVDWISSVMTHIIGTPKLHQQTYHLVPSKRTSIALMSEVLADALTIPKKSGKQNSNSETGFIFSDLIQTFLSQMHVYRSYWRNDPVFDYTNTHNAAPHLPCPVMNKERLRTLCRYAVESNFGLRKSTAAISVSATKTEPPEPVKNRQPIAIIGMECRLPGADNAEEFWQNIRNGISSLAPVPKERLDKELYYNPEIGLPDRTYTDLGGVIEYRPIDRNICPFPDGAEKRFDVAHLNLCETAARAVRSAGIDPAHFPIANTGVFIGNTRCGDKGSLSVIGATVSNVLETLDEIEDFHHIQSGTKIKNNVTQIVKSYCPRRQTDGSPFTSASSAAVLISQTLKTNGPCMVFNSACASSLQALAQAVNALRMGTIDAAVVGGASFFSSDTLVLFSYARSLTKNRSCPFDDEADGLIVGEGAVVLILKRLDDAIRDGDKIRAVIGEVGVSSDGKGKSLWAPRKEGQIEAMRRAYENSDAGRVGYIEAHATSTALGDATETEALTEFFGEHFRNKNISHKIPLGSAKGNVGHTLEAAGITGLFKTVLMLEHKTIPPVAGLRTLNKKIDWENIPFYAPMKETAWETSDGNPRKAAVNSFGIGGLNVCVAVEEHIPQKTKDTGSVQILRNENEPIAVIGFGGVLPGGLNMKDWAEFLLSGQTAIRQKKNSSDHGGFIDGFEYDWKKNKVPPKQIANANPLQFMILESVNEAWASAHLDHSPANRLKTGVVVGTAFGGDFSVTLAMTLFLPKLQQFLRSEMQTNGLPLQKIETVLDEFKQRIYKKMPALIDETGSFTASALASRITKSFDLMGGAVALDAENASSAAALDYCVLQLLLHKTDMMVCISGQQDMGAGIYESLNVTENMPTNPRCSPFDKQFAGSVPGEGCGTLLLKRLCDARRDGNPIYALLRGVGAASGVNSRRAQKTALQRLYAHTNTPINFLEVVTTSPAENTVNVIDTFASGEISIGSLSERIGHLGSAAGMAAMLKTCIAFSQKKAPANINIRETAPFIKRYKNINVPVSPVEWNGTETPKTVNINSGSYNIYNILLEEYLQ